MNLPVLSDFYHKEDQTDVVSESELSLNDDSEENPEEPQAVNLTSYLKSLDINLPSSSRASDFDQEDEDFSLNESYSQKGRFSMITEEQTTNNFMREFDGFYREMIGKVRSLRTTPALQNQNLGKISNVNEENLFRNLKDTPEVEKKLNTIKELDDELKNIISLYKVEKSERLQTQLEMCNEMYNNNTLPERDTQMFLDLCDFEFSEHGDEDDKEIEESQKSKSQPKGNFIQRNMELAKEGFFANCSLTDEEKIKLEDILSKQNEDETNTNERRVYYNPRDGKMLSNAYRFTSETQNRMDDLDSELEKFSRDERGNEKTDTCDSLGNLNDCLLKLSLDRIDSKLNELKAKEAEVPNTSCPSNVTEDSNEDEECASGDT